VTDMVRISGWPDEWNGLWDRGSACVPKQPSGRAGVGAQRGLIELDVAGRRLHLDVTAEELEKRKESWTKPELPLTDGDMSTFISNMCSRQIKGQTGFPGRRFRGAGQQGFSLILAEGGNTYISNSDSAYEFTPCLLGILLL